MSEMVILPDRPYVYNFTKKEYEYMTQDEYLTMRARQHRAEFIPRQVEYTEPVHTTQDDQEQPIQQPMDRTPISKETPTDENTKADYIKEILTTDKDLNVNQVEGVETVILQQEQEADILLEPTVPPAPETKTDTQQYEKPTEEQLRAAETLTKQATPVISSAATSLTPTQIQDTATTYLSQPQPDQGKYDSQTLTKNSTTHQKLVTIP